MNSLKACTILETEFASVLLSQLKLGFPSGYLDMTMNVIQTSFHQGYRKAAAQATGDSERQKIIFLTALNCSENSMDYVARYVWYFVTIIVLTYCEKNLFLCNTEAKKSESQKHYKFLAFGLEFAKLFLDSLFLTSVPWKNSKVH